MKKWMIILLGCMMAIGFTLGCNNENSNNDDSNDVPDNEQVTEDEYGDWLDNVLG